MRSVAMKSSVLSSRKYAWRITDIDRAGDVSRRIGVGRANVPNDGIPRYGFSDIRVIGDRGGRGMGDMSDVDPADRQRNKHQTIHDEPPIVYLLRPSAADQMERRVQATSLAIERDLAELPKV
jgi:hypothetical protein